MKCTLIQQKASKAIDDNFHAILTDDQKKEKDELACASIILQLFYSI